jgi:hypothetical protein
VVVYFGGRELPNGGFVEVGEGKGEENIMLCGSRPSAGGYGSSLVLDGLLVLCGHYFSSTLV